MTKMKTFSDFLNENFNNPRIERKNDLSLYSDSDAGRETPIMTIIQNDDDTYTISVSSFDGKGSEFDNFNYASINLTMKQAEAIQDYFLFSFRQKENDIIEPSVNGY